MLGVDQEILQEIARTQALKYRLTREIFRANQAQVDRYEEKLIQEQVTSGVAVRMALLYLIATVHEGESLVKGLGAIA